MKSWIRASAGVLATLLVTGLAGCGGGSDNPSSARFRAVHASADAPAVDVFANGTLVAGNLAFGTASGLSNAPAGPTTVAVKPAGGATSVLQATVQLFPGHQQSAIVIGSASNTAPQGQELQAVAIDDPGTSPELGKAKLRVVHGAPGVPAVDVYVTASSTQALPAAPTIPGLAYASAAPASGTKALEVPGGNYRIRVTPAGQPTQLAFDSGTVALPANADLLVTAIPAAGSVSPIALLVAPASGNSFQIPDQRAAVRVGHFSPNTPAVDVYLPPAGSAKAAGNLVVSNATFGAATAHATVAPGGYRASVALHNTNPEVLGLDVTITPGEAASVFAVGLLNGSGPQALRLLPFADDRAPVAGKAKVRVIHLSPDAPAVDVVVLSGGQIAARVVQNLAFPDATATPLVLDPGPYTLAVVPTGLSSPVLPSGAGVPVTLTAGQVLTVAATGCLSTTGACAGGSAFGFTILDDRN